MAHTFQIIMSAAEQNERDARVCNPLFLLILLLLLLPLSLHFLISFAAFCSLMWVSVALFRQTCHASLLLPLSLLATGIATIGLVT